MTADQTPATPIRTLRRKLRQEVGLRAAPGFPQMGTTHYLPWLEQLHRRLRPRVYLEIGTESGASLAYADCLSIAVDPRFRLEGDVMGARPELHLFQGTSDAFFAGGLLDRLGLRIDLAFLDGMHLFEYLLRDFLNTEPHMQPDGTMLLHDCVPFDAAVADRDWDRARTASWTGDVWKLIPILREYRPDLTVQVLDLAPTGLVVVTGLDPQNTVLRDRQDEIVARYAAVTLDSYGLDRFSRNVALVRVADRPRRPAGTRVHNGTIAIKTCVPDAAVQDSWGDWHFANSLAAAFRRLGQPARVDILPDWAAAPADDALDLVLQGHDHHPPRDGIPAMLWLIYPGKRFDQARLIDYDHVFVASAPYARKMQRRVPGLAPSVLLQAFDAGVMKPVTSSRRKELVFVGNNHFGGADRPMASLARQAGLPLRLWGGGWQGPDWAPYLQAETLANADLGRVYATSLAVLCDHTPMMARNGFVSNRVFDALACGVPVITDPVEALPDDFAPLVEVVQDAQGLAAAAARLAAEPAARRSQRRAFARAMAETHSFDARARQILDKARDLSLL